MKKAFHGFTSHIKSQHPWGPIYLPPHHGLPWVSHSNVLPAPRSCHVWNVLPECASWSCRGLALIMPSPVRPHPSLLTSCFSPLQSASLTVKGFVSSRDSALRAITIPCPLCGQPQIPPGPENMGSGALRPHRHQGEEGKRLIHAVTCREGKPILAGAPWLWGPEWRLRGDSDSICKALPEGRRGAGGMGAYLAPPWSSPPGLPPSLPAVQPCTSDPYPT